jgi:hypothetical protein
MPKTAGPPAGGGRTRVTPLFQRRGLGTPRRVRPRLAGPNGLSPIDYKAEKPNGTALPSCLRIPPGETDADLACMRHNPDAWIIFPSL